MKPEVEFGNWGKNVFENEILYEMCIFPIKSALTFNIVRNKFLYKLNSYNIL